jgi:hypothetical protein
MGVIDFAEGMLLAHEAVLALRKGVVSTKFVTGADRLLESALPRFEATLRSDPSHLEARVCRILSLSPPFA